eukprot:6454916-Amphidinium_carterae.1
MVLPNGREVTLEVKHGVPIYHEPGGDEKRTSSVSCPAIDLESQRKQALKNRCDEMASILDNVT